MAETGITIDMEGADKVLKKLERMTRKVENLSSLHSLWGASVVRWVARNFEREGRLAVGSKGWEPLSRATKQGRRKGKRKGSPKILQDTGNLRRSFGFNASNQGVEIGTGVVYAAAHQKGQTIPARTIRPIKAKALRIPLADGSIIFRKSANIPSYDMPKRPMLPEKFRLIEEDIRDITVKYMRRR